MGYYVAAALAGSALRCARRFLPRSSADGGRLPHPRPTDGLGQDRRRQLPRRKELEIKEQLLKRREDLENELRKVRSELHEQERRIDKRESDVNQLENEFSKKEKCCRRSRTGSSKRTKVIETQERELDRMVKQEQEELYKISGLNREQAAERLATRLDGDLNAEAGRVIMRKESELKQNSEKLAREIIGMAVQRYASAHTSETTVSTIDIPSDEVKGRIIGREGRNIRASRRTGVDVIVDDTPGVVVVSCFDTVRREIAKRSLAKLIQDGRIHPAKIEEVVRETLMSSWPFLCDFSFILFHQVIFGGYDDHSRFDNDVAQFNIGELILLLVPRQEQLRKL